MSVALDAETRGVPVVSATSLHQLSRSRRAAGISIVVAIGLRRLTSILTEDSIVLPPADSACLRAMETTARVGSGSPETVDMGRCDSMNKLGAPNAFTRLIQSRRSVRDGYVARSVPENVIDEIVRCGLSAPSSKNARPWRLHVVTDRKLLSELAHAVATAEGADSYVPSDPTTGKARLDWPSTVVESAATLAAVPLAIFIENLGAFNNGRATLASVPQQHLQDSLVGYTFEVLGIGTALAAMWHAANAMGLQASCIGDVCVAERLIAQRLGIVGDLACVLALGYSTAIPRSRPPIDPHDVERVVRHRHA